MSKKRIGLALLSAVLGGALLTAVPARSQQQSTTTITFKVIPKARVVDLLGRGYSAGDIVLSRGVGRDPDTAEKVGDLTVRCQRTKLSADRTWAWILCDGELRTPIGKITFTGTRRQGETCPTGEFAITGGTGDYNDAGGSVSTEDDAARNTWTFQVLRLEG